MNKLVMSLTEYIKYTQMLLEEKGTLRAKRTFLTKCIKEETTFLEEVKAQIAKRGEGAFLHGEQWFSFHVHILADQLDYSKKLRQQL